MGHASGRTNCIAASRTRTDQNMHVSHILNYTPSTTNTTQQIRYFFHAYFIILAIIRFVFNTERRKTKRRPCVRAALRCAVCGKTAVLPGWRRCGPHPPLGHRSAPCERPRLEQRVLPLTLLLLPKFFEAHETRWIQKACVCARIFTRLRLLLLSAEQRLTYIIEGTGA